MLPLLNKRQVTLSRKTEAVNAEGEAQGTLTVQKSFVSSWGSPNVKDLNIATQNNFKVERVYLAPSDVDIRVDDIITDEQDYTVNYVQDVRVHQRVFAYRMGEFL